MVQWHHQDAFHEHPSAGHQEVSAGHVEGRGLLTADQTVSQQVHRQRHLQVRQETMCCDTLFIDFFIFFFDLIEVSLAVM